MDMAGEVTHLALWDVVNSFRPIPYETPVDHHDFEEWWDQMWQPVERACKNVALHVYVLKGALQEFQESQECHPGQTWDEAFNETHEQKQLTIWCTSVGLEPTGFIEMGFEHYRKKCKMKYEKLNKK